MMHLCIYFAIVALRHKDMPSSGLRGFVQAFTADKPPTPIAAFLVPTTAGSTSHAPLQRVGRRLQHFRHYGSIIHDVPIQTKKIKHPPSGYYKSDFATALSSSPRRRNPEAWVDLLEPYLPLQLRADQNDAPNGAILEKNVRPIQGLPGVLFRARTTKPLKLDLLSYMGIQQGRWTAVVWLVKAILKQCAAANKVMEREILQSVQNAPPRVTEMSLDEITLAPIHHEGIVMFSAKHPSLDDSTDPESRGNRKTLDAMRREGVGQLWQSLGSMILQAADRPTEDPASKIVMSHVLQILAHMHHINALPESIYNYDPAKDTSVLQRPPTLHLLSSRIMTILSDSVWKAQEKTVASEAGSVGAKYTYKDHELPVATLQPQIRELGPEVWLDLVLWCCVEGGWITEGAWIVSEMARRKGDQRWSAINWHAIRELSVPIRNLAAQVKSEIAKSRMNQIAGGIGIAGGSASSTFMEMAPRTVSSEVIVVLVDGLVNTISKTTTMYGNSPAEVQQYLNMCKNLLERKHFALESNVWDSIVLRLVDSGAFNPNATPRVLEQIVNLTPTYFKELEDSDSTNSPSSSTYDYIVDQTAASLGLLHRALYAFALSGDVQGALRIFKRLQSLVDANRYRTIKSFADDLHQHEGDSVESTGNDSDDVAGLHPQIPVATLAVLLDLVTDAKLFDFGKWLLYSEEADGSTIPLDMYSERSIQPALLRFATATADSTLLNRVTRQLEAPLPENILRALMHCQIAIGKWDAVEDLLTYFQRQRRMRWNASDVMAIASTILHMDNEVRNNTSREDPSTSDSRTLLRSLLQGKYNSERDPWELPDLSQIRLMNQLGRILSTVPGDLCEKASSSTVMGRSSTPSHVPAQAFNILVEAIVDIYGSTAGKQLWDRWCDEARIGDAEVSSEQSSNLITRDGFERVVTPNLYILRTIMRPIAQARLNAGDAKVWTKGTIDKAQVTQDEHHVNQTLQTLVSDSIEKEAGVSATAANSTAVLTSEQDLVEWGTKMYRRFSLTDSEISIELPDAIPRRPKEDTPS